MVLPNSFVKKIGNGQTDGKMKMSVYIGGWKHYTLNNTNNIVAATNLSSSDYLSYPCRYYRMLFVVEILIRLTQD